MPTPVIVVPGIMGSRLALGDLPWDPDAPSVMVKWSFAHLEHKRVYLSAGATPGRVLTHLHHSVVRDVWEDEPDEQLRAARLPVDTAEQRGWAGPAWEFYGPGLLDLQTRLNPGAAPEGVEQFPVFAFGYDWRRSNAATGAELAGFTEQTCAAVGAEQAIIVTHSMGGLVTRAALAAVPGFAARVRRVVHVGQPAEGTATVYRRFLTGVVARYDELAPWNEQETWIQERALAQILGNHPDEFATLMSVVPSAMELLPTPRFGEQFSEPWLADGNGTDLGGDHVYATYLRPDDFGILASAPDAGVATDLAREVDAVRAFHALVAGVSHPDTWCIYGTGLRTDRSTRPGADPLVPESRTGDGLVDAASADGRTLAAGTVRGSEDVTAVEHNKLFSDPGVLSKVRAAVTRGPA